MSDYYRIHVSLLDVKPKPWRRFLIRKAATFMELHEAIQDACGWENAHLFAFRAPHEHECIAGLPDPEEDSNEPDAERVRLADVFRTKLPVSCLYQYDFGDDWRHEVTCEAVEKHDARFNRRLMEGVGTFPPEDCGGAPGFMRCVAAVTGKGWAEWMGDEQQRKEVVEWLGDWQPADFNIVATKKRFDG